MQRHSILKGVGQEISYADDRTIHKIIARLFTQDVFQQVKTIKSIMKKKNAETLTTNTILALQALIEKKKEMRDYRTLPVVYNILELCDAGDPNPEVFLASLKPGETLTSRINSLVHSNTVLAEAMEQPTIKEKIEEGGRFYDNEQADIKMILGLIERINTVKFNHLCRIEPKTFLGKWFRKDGDKDGESRPVRTPIP